MYNLLQQLLVAFCSYLIIAILFLTSLLKKNLMELKIYLKELCMDFHE